MLSSWQIYDLINACRYEEADAAIRERLLASGARPAVVSGAMYYAYEHGHSAGQDEVLRIAMGLCSEVFEA